jgi:hypothetical protein
LINLSEVRIKTGQMFKDKIFVILFMLLNVSLSNLAIKLCDPYMVALVGIRVDPIKTVTAVTLLADEKHLAVIGIRAKTPLIF